MRAMRAFISSMESLSDWDLAGDLLVAGGEGVLLVLHAELEAVAVVDMVFHGVRGLLDELLEHAKAFVVGLLQFGDGVL